METRETAESRKQRVQRSTVEKIIWLRRQLKHKTLMVEESKQYADRKEDCMKFFYIEKIALRSDGDINLVFNNGEKRIFPLDDLEEMVDCDGMFTQEFENDLEVEFYRKYYRKDIEHCHVTQVFTVL